MTQPNESQIKNLVADLASKVTFDGAYTTLSALQAAKPVSAVGHIAIVDPGSGTNAIIYIWDSNDGWVQSGGSSSTAFADITGSPGDNSALATALGLKEDKSNKNIANGYAGLDGTGKVAAAQLPSYVDDVIEVANFAALPGTGETGKIYVTLDTNFEYRWSGSTYIQLVASPGSTDALAEGTTNKYFTVARVLATILTGISFGTASAVLATDTILVGFGKLQAQITALIDDTTARTTSVYSSTKTDAQIAAAIAAQAKKTIIGSYQSIM